MANSKMSQVRECAENTSEVVDIVHEDVGENEISDGADLR